MTRLASLGSMLFLALLLLFPAAAEAQTAGDERGVLVGVREDVTLGATSSAAVVVGVQGHLTVSGHARLVVMVDGEVTLEGSSASVENLVAVRATVTLGPGTTVGTIRALDSTIAQDPAATVQHGTEDLKGSAFVLVGILGTFIVLLYLGWAVSVLFAAAVVAAVAPRQTRRMARSVSREPLKVLGAGLLGFLVSMIVGALFFVTIIGIPLAVMVFMTFWLMAFVGFLVMGVWLGDLLLRRGRSPDVGRPVGSAVLGVLLLLVLGLIPLVSLFVGWFGFGTVALNSWRALMGRGGDGPPSADMQGADLPGQQQGWGQQPPPQQPGWGQQPPPQQPGWGQQPPPQQPGWGQQPPPQQPGWGQQPPPAGPPPGWGQQPPPQSR